MRAARRALEPPPPIWLDFCAHLRLTLQLTNRWWWALQTSPAPCCRTIRHAVLFADGRDLPGTPGFVTVHFPAERLVHCLEQSVSVGQLDRTSATALEESIFAYLEPAGRWRLSHREGHAHATPV